MPPSDAQAFASPCQRRAQSLRVHVSAGASLCVHGSAGADALTLAAHRREDALASTAKGYLMRTEDCRLEDPLAILADETDPADYPWLTAWSRVCSSTVRTRCGARRRATPRGRGPSWPRAWAAGPGIVVIEGAFDPTVVDRATASSSGSSPPKAGGGAFR